MEIIEGKTRILKSCPKCRERTENVVYKITKKGYSIKLKCLRCLKHSSRHYDIRSIVNYEIKNYNLYVRKRNKRIAEEKKNNNNLILNTRRRKDVLVTETGNTNHIIKCYMVKKDVPLVQNQKEVASERN